MIKVHLRGTWAPCKHAAVHWRSVNKSTGEKVGGRIINTVSGAGLTGNFGQTNYAPAKAAIASLTQTLSLELYKMGVTVNAVGPAAATRITGTMPGVPAVIEADEVPEDEWNRMDPARLLAAGGMARLGRGRPRDRPDHPCGRRGHHLDEGLGGRADHQQRREAVGTPRSWASSWPPTSSSPGLRACATENRSKPRRSVSAGDRVTELGCGPVVSVAQ